MKQLSAFTYGVVILFLSINFLLVNCSGNDTEDESPTDEFELAGTYCLDFSIMGSQMVITSGSSGQYTININDFDGGLRSATGTGSLSGNTLETSGTVSTEAGTADFELNLSINETTGQIAGLFNVVDPNGNAFFNSSLRGTKGACNFELTPSDVSSIIGQPYLTDLHVELNKIQKISRYRSAAGHNFVDYSGESCVNLKHYFHTYEEGQQPQLSDLPSSLGYFAPANGTIVAMGQTRVSEDPTDYEMDIRLEANPNIVVRLFHLTPTAGLEVGSTVTSGQQVGQAPTIHVDSGDFAVYVLTNNGYRHVSMFEIMAPGVLDQYIARGVDQNWRDDLFYATGHSYPSGITCENGTWGNLRHPNSNFLDDFFILDN